MLHYTKLCGEHFERAKKCKIWALSKMKQRGK